MTAKQERRGKVVQPHVLYLGEINDQQQAAWQKAIEVFAHGQSLPQTVALFPEDRPVEVADYEVVRVKLSELALRRPRQWGACWLSCLLYEQLQLDGFWAQRLPLIISVCDSVAVRNCAGSTARAAIAPSAHVQRDR